MGKFIIDSTICTDDEQSKLLIQMGLNPETADMALHLSFVDSDSNAFNDVIGFIDYQIEHGFIKSEYLKQ